jgi:hypothetical protein
MGLYPWRGGRGDIGMQRPNRMDVTIVLDVNGMAEQSPSVTVVVLDVIANL